MWGDGGLGQYSMAERYSPCHQTIHLDWLIVKGNKLIIDWGGGLKAVKWAIIYQLILSFWTTSGQSPSNHPYYINITDSSDKKISTDWVGVEQEVK